MFTSKFAFLEKKTNSDEITSKTKITRQRIKPLHNLALNNKIVATNVARNLKTQI